MIPTIPLEQARTLLIDRQFPSVAEGPDGLRRVFDQLGYVQIDTIQVIERAHHHTLWNRVPGYQPGLLHELHAREKGIFEYWGHAASYLPMSDYRFYRPRMERMAREYGWETRWLSEHPELCRKVLERVREEGPLSTADFEHPKQPRAAGMWPDWKPAKAALEILFWKGELMVTERRNFQRVYDLTERVLPPDIDTNLPDPDEIGRFQVLRAIRANGAVSEYDINFHLFTRDRAAVKNAIKHLLERGDIVSVHVEGLGKTLHYLTPELLRQIPDPGPGTVRLLSPFDNLVINRKRLSEWFGFDYVIECYVPAAKRKHGYFVLPVLWGDRLVARLDPKAERKEGVLTVKLLRFEKGFDEFSDLAPDLAKALAGLARFNGCSSVRLETCEPKKAAAGITRALKREGL